jgi:Gram-negative bacterial TonB protein C-terminal
LNFLVRHEPHYRNWAGSLKVLLSGRAPHMPGWLALLDRRPMRLQHPRRTRTVMGSMVFHFSLLVFVLEFPWGVLFPPQEMGPMPVISADNQLFYPLPKQKMEIHAEPKSAMRGQHPTAKASPSQGAQRAAGSGLKTPAPTPQFTLVLKPPRADNDNQTIVQASVAPDLRLKHSLPLPNVLLSGMTQEDPKMPLTGAAPKAIVKPSAGAPSMNVPKPVIPNVALAVQMPAEKPPLLAAPEVVLPLPTSQDSLGSIYASKKENSASKSGRGLLVLGSNPVPPGSLMRLPPGNRYGEFSVALLGGKSGVPSGPGGPAMGGGGNASTGAAKAAGSGSGSGAARVSGDVGGAGNGASAFAAFGPASNGSGNSEGILPPWAVANMVYPVARDPKIPAINLIVTAGPIGGGGLGAFGVLSCSTIYTIYLSMPGKPWVLQYCQKQTAAPATPAPTGGVVHMGSGISPPWALDKYDFHRPPIAAYKRDRMIVLQGVIDKDGAVTNLRLYQGVNTVADQAALAAFGKWKFHPASGADGKPLTVEMLVGIPATTQ